MFVRIFFLHLIGNFKPFPMKLSYKDFTVGTTFLFLFSTIFMFGQIENNTSQIDRGTYEYTMNDAQNPCISAEEYARIENEINVNLEKIGLSNRSSNSVLTTSLLWPLRPAIGFSQCDFHFIGAYVDQNTTASAIQDYNCESNTYDGHQGTDIAIWPYSFYKMDHSQIEVIAAAGGTIIQRADGNFDRNCTSNTLIANSIIIQHADGSYALYWHMKNGSITSKIVGQTVVAGEYLGVVGSSGSSSGPHLHFEVRATSASNSYKDPFTGTCNLLNPTSWWAVQKPHTNPAVIKVSVNTTDLVAPGCPTSETPNESDVFSIPFQGAGLAPGYAKFYIFLREAAIGTNVDLKILNPNGSTFNNWTYSISTFYKVSYYGFSKVLPTNSGLYTFQATYNGVTCTKTFQIQNPLGISTYTATDLVISPNPVKEQCNLVGNGIENGNYSYSLMTISRQIIKTEPFEISNNIIEKSISLSGFPTGIYFLEINGPNSRIVKKISKQ
jgi:murein DD-endopeptidase MepM/ murein hydrolase activator NlpD